MNILYLCHRIPYPPNKGDKIRAFHQLKALGQEHRVDLFSLADDVEDAAGHPELERHCRQVVVSRLDRRVARWRALPYLATRKPLTLPYFCSGELTQRIRDAIRLRKYDRIFVYCSAMFQYVERLMDIPLIADLVDVDSDKWKQYAQRTSLPARWVYGREAVRLREYEAKVCRRADCVLVATACEAELLRGISPRANVHVVGNGVDADYFQLRPSAAGRREPAIVFTGDMRYFPNEEAVMFFAGRVLPLIRSAIPEVHFLIVGRDPTPRVKRLAAIAGVEVTGYVPDIREYLAQAQVAVAPFTIAAGIQNKVLEALASGIPVVATSSVVKGLSGSVADIIQTGNSPEALAVSVVRLLREPRFAEEVGIEGRRRVLEEYSWSRWDQRLLALVREPKRPVHRRHGGT